MRLATFTALAMLLSAGYAFAGGGAPVDPKPGGPPSDHPGALFDETKGQDVWTKVAGGSDSLSYDKVGPYITNLKQADPDNDGQVTKTEFMGACKMGLVKEQPSEPADTTRGGGTPAKP